MIHYFETLGLQKGATQKEIQAAYDHLSKELAKKKKSEQEFFKEEYKKVQEAYKALSNSSILATQSGALKNIFEQPTASSKEMNTPPLSKKNRFTYFLDRKRNIITFIILVLILKPVIHFSLFRETEQIVNYDKKIYENRYGDAYIIVGGELVKDTTSYYKTKYNKFTKNGETYIMQPSNCENCDYSVFYYPKETRGLSFRMHIQKIFRVKLYLFFVSILTLSLIVFLFNDKIKVR